MGNPTKSRRLKFSTNLDPEVAQPRGTAGVVQSSASSGVTHMGMIEDHRIEAAVQEALGPSAEARAMALVQIAVDPAATKSRLEALHAASAAHDAARDAAEAAATEAKELQAGAEAKLADLTRQEQLHLDWKSRNEATLKQAQVDLAHAQEDLVQKGRAHAAAVAELQDKTARHDTLIELLRSYLARVEAA